MKTDHEDTSAETGREGGPTPPTGGCDCGCMGLAGPREAEEAE